MSNSKKRKNSSWIIKAKIQQAESCFRDSEIKKRVNLLLQPPSDVAYMSCVTWKGKNVVKKKKCDKIEKLNKEGTRYIVVYVVTSDDHGHWQWLRLAWQVVQIELNSRMKWGILFFLSLSFSLLRLFNFTDAISRKFLVFKFVSLFHQNKLAQVVRHLSF